MTQLFEYAVIFDPIATKEQAERGEKPRSFVIVDVKHVLAQDQQEATLLAARDIPEGYTDKLSQVRIAIRPF